MDLTVRRVTPSEGRLLADLRLRALADAPYAFETTYEEAARLTPPEWSERASRQSAGDRAAGFIAEFDGEPCGMVAGYRDDEPSVANLVSMWVAPAHRRHGAARALIDAVIGWASEAGAHEVRLWVADGNEAAQRLYESAGFTPTGALGHVRGDLDRAERQMTRSPRTPG